MTRLVVFDYFVVHSDDIPQGPASLHPRSPRRAGELLVRREVIRAGLNLYRSRGLVSRCFEEDGVYYSATDYSGAFLDALDASYTRELRERAEWVVEEFGAVETAGLRKLVTENLGAWGAEFENESVLFEENSLVQ